MLLCRNKALSPLQRTFVLLFSITLLVTSLLSVLSLHFLERDSSHPVLGLLPAIPFLLMMLLIPRYFGREKDEFVRALVLRALLWGFAVPMVVDTLWGFLWKLAPVGPVMPMINIDLFCTAALFVLSFQIRRYQ